MRNAQSDTLDGFMCPGPLRIQQQPSRNAVFAKARLKTKERLLTNAELLEHPLYPIIVDTCVYWTV